MLKLVVVEDEVWMREALRTVIDWRAIGIEHAGEAGDGAKALALIESIRPDIVIADIRLPVMDGIALLEELARRNIQTQVVMISAYRDFEYARSAMKWGAFDYILKPVYEDQLLGVMERLTRKIKEETAQRVIIQKRTESFRFSLPLARQKMLETIFAEDRLPIVDPARKLETLGIELHPERTAVIGLLVYDWGTKGQDMHSRSLIRFAIGNIVEEVLHGLWKSTSIPMDGLEFDTVVLVSPLDSSMIDREEEAQLLKEKGAEMLRSVREYLGIEMSIGIGPFDTVSRMKHSGLKALQAGSLALFEGVGQFNAEEETQTLVEPETNPILPSSDWRRSMLLALRTRDEGAVSRLADSLAVHMASLRGRYCPLHLTRLLRFELLHLLDNWLGEIGGTVDDQSAYYRIKSAWTALRPTLPRIKPLLLEALALWNEQQEVNRHHKWQMEQVRIYLRSRYREGVTLNEAAEQLFISPWYLSKLFHEVVGMKFSHYITCLRMNEAKELLRLTNRKIYEIAETVGYRDVRHFVKTFKDLEGLSPSQYRKSLV